MDLFGGNHPRDLRRWVVEVTGDDRLLGTDDDARRLHPDLDPVDAVVALLGGVLVGIDVQGVVGTCLHARLASDAPRGVEVDDPVVPVVQGTGRADADARGVGAVIASHHPEVALGVWPRPLLDVFHPGSVDSQRHLVLGLAGDRAGMTADARVLIDDEPVARHQPSPLTSMDLLLAIPRLPTAQASDSFRPSRG